MADPRLTLTRQDHVAVLTIRRPDKLNAFDIGMLEALRDACGELGRDPEARVAVITGEGKAFSAGGDIRAWAAMPADRFGFDWVRYGHRVFGELAELRIPVIAALNGHALGGGLELAAAADIRIAAPGIRLGLPETGLGMVPGWSGTQRLVQRFGAQLVRRMVLGGEVFSADEGLALGLVDHVAADVLDAAMAYASRVASRGPAALQVAKLMLASSTGESPAASIETLAAMLVAKTGDLREGVAAFGDKRAAQFKGEW
jgi:enoyl-CoA hydratase/carnithine racemase